MIQPDAQKVDKVSEKAGVGANRETNWTLVQMAKNFLHYIQLAGRWEAGKTDVRKAKKRFEELMAEEKVPHDSYSTEAWRHRPEYCNDLRKAIDLYLAKMEKARKAVDKDVGMTGMTRLEIDATIAAAKAQLDQKIAGLKRAVASMEKRKGESRIQEEFPGAGGFLKQRAVSVKLREWERKAGGPMDKKERALKFPELEFGWPDIQGDEMPLPFEKELKATEKARAQEQLDNCNKILNAALKKQKKADAEKQKMISKSLPAPKPVDRRNNPEPDGAEVRYVVQPGQKRPAAMAAPPQSMPRNEGEAPQKRKIDVDSEEEDDGAGALGPPARKQQKRAASPSLQMSENPGPFVAPEGQGQAYDILFRDDEENEDPPPRPKHSPVLSDHEISDMDSDNED